MNYERHEIVLGASTAASDPKDSERVSRALRSLKMGRAPSLQEGRGGPGGWILDKMLNPVRVR
jgi:hypothetical protein